MVTSNTFCIVLRVLGALRRTERISNRKMEGTQERMETQWLLEYLIDGHRQADLMLMKCSKL